MATRLGRDSTTPTPRSAIVVAEIDDRTIGLLVDGVSDIRTVPETLPQPVPEISISPGMNDADGIIAQPEGRICRLNLDRMFETAERMRAVAA
ncbi:CheW-like protein [Rhizobium sp. PP-F2F-G48]|nr:CheW-like protein [Rhizobium sp. PP-F2F-G48]